MEYKWENKIEHGSHINKYFYIARLATIYKYCIYIKIYELNCPDPTIEDNTTTPNN